MNYEVIALACEQLSYRDKLRLAQLLIQMARKEEEEAHPMHREEHKSPKNFQRQQNKLKDVDTVQYVIDRLLKLKPVNKRSLVNAIKSMFQFQGGISDSELDRIIGELQKRKYLNIDTKNSVSYTL